MLLLLNQNGAGQETMRQRESGHPVDVEVTEEAVWVSIQNPDYVLKIQP